MTAGRQSLFWLVGLAVLLAAVFILRDIMLPFVAGMAVAYFLDPVVDMLEARVRSRTLATALVTALAMLPIAVDSDNPGREIMGPMATIIIGGLVSSTILNLLILPALMLRYGRFVGRSGDD